MSDRALNKITKLPVRRAVRDLEAMNKIKAGSTDNARTKQRLKEVMTAHLQQLMTRHTLSTSAAAERLMADVDDHAAPANVMAAAQALARRGNRCPSRASLINWAKAYDLKGKSGLVDRYKPRQRKAYGWEGRAVELFNSPNRPGYNTVAYWLRNEGFDSAKDHRVRHYLKSLPSSLGAEGIARSGERRWKGKHTPHVIRDASVLDVGLIYEGDGHCCDVYVAHPNTGNAWRPELTPWVDVRSRYVVSWSLTEAESGITTLMSLAQAVATYDHVPAMIHVDPGSGFRAKLITDETTGFLSRLHIETSFALPGNWRGKGLTEGWFKHFEERCGKRFVTFCGHCRTDEQLSRLSDKIKRGELALPSLAEYHEAIAEYIDAYNHTPQRGLDNRTPADLWAELQPVKSHIEPIELIRQREQRKVTAGRVQLFNRKYTAPEMLLFNGKSVIAEFDLHDMSNITLRDMQGRFICEALQDGGQPWMPISRIEELKNKRLQGQVKRLEQHAQEKAARARTIMDTSHVSKALDITERGLPEPKSPTKELSIDPYKTDY